ncbi:glycerophosphodiester phosphodiesterase family protein [Aurantiacibacter sp. D1-12]|uniref:glycerophosphodiester phosphodiesterase family protein n=1 Tax=Aurantiacibacter sp. D1-12 TaxID=2993658 RepID=UPI00237CD735|nr:glycerophosphodiester phosphodiesterase family protein [Aurantiacibacter sp. D1-12]MDE1468562.1 glycerophosphodiester phosphodiesterase family protein [Aurantiacibacter sp. D1-12]
MADHSWLSERPYAHRGLHETGVPENSLAAFSAAMERGFGIECDVRVSADGRAMVFHDAELDRLTGQSGKTADQSVGALTALTLLGSKESIPTLRDMLAHAAGKVPLLLELKSDKTTNVHKLCRAVRRDLEGYSGHVAVMSFDPRISAWFAQRVPGMARGLVITEEGARTLTGGFKRAAFIRHAKPQFLAYDIRDLPSRFASKQAARGLPLLTWTVRSSAHAQTALECGATPIAEGPGVAAWESLT